MKQRLKLFTVFLLSLGLLLPSGEAFAVNRDEKIAVMKRLGIVNGYPDGSLGLDKPIKRSEAAALLVRIGKVEHLANRRMQIYPDVPITHWANGYIAVTKAIRNKNGVTPIGGYPDGTFRPERNITNAEMMKILVASKDKRLTKAKAAKATWPDSWIQWAEEVGIAGPRAGLEGLNPNAPATRGDVFVMLFNGFAVKKTPAPAKNTPAPAPGGNTPAPAPGRNTPVPVPDISTPVPLPGRNTPAPAPGRNTPVPVPDISTPLPMPGNYNPTPKPENNKPRRNKTAENMDRLIDAFNAGAGYDRAAFKKEFTRLINADRAERGLKPLVWSDEFTQGAGVRCTELAANGSINVNGQSHVRLNGDRWDTAFCYMNLNFGGENLLSTSINSSQPLDQNDFPIIADGTELARTFYKMWWESPGHRANMMDPGYRYFYVEAKAAPRKNTGSYKFFIVGSTHFKG